MWHQATEFRTEFQHFGGCCITWVKFHWEDRVSVKNEIHAPESTKLSGIADNLTINEQGGLDLSWQFNWSDIPAISKFTGVQPFLPDKLFGDTEHYRRVWVLTNTDKVSRHCWSINELLKIVTR